MAKILKPKIKITRIIFDLIKIVCVVAVLIVAIQTIPPFFKHKEVSTKSEITASYQKTENEGKKGSIDVLTIGNSSLYSGFNPLQLWKEHGYTSFVASAPKQNMCLSYYMLKEILTVQSPKVLLLDVSNLFETRGNSAVKENLQLTYTYCYPVFRETNRWKEMQSKGVVQTKTQSPKLVARGYYYSTVIQANTKGSDYMKETTEVEPLSSYSETYLPKIMELAKQNNIQVFFTVIPCAAAWTYKKHNTAVNLAQQYNVELVDMNVGKDIISDFNWNTDSRDGGNHLNYYGTKRVTKYIGNYLKNNYSLTDYRGNKNYSDWDEDYKLFMKRAQKK